MGDALHEATIDDKNHRSKKTKEELKKSIIDFSPSNGSLVYRILVNMREDLRRLTGKDNGNL